MVSRRQDQFQIGTLEKGKGRYWAEGQEIEFGEGQTEHRWTQLRGALPKPDALCVYLTGFTPWQKDLLISCSADMDCFGFFKPGGV